MDQSQASLPSLTLACVPQSSVRHRPPPLQTAVTKREPSLWQASSSPRSPPRESYRTGPSSCQNSVCCWTRRTTTRARWGRAAEGVERRGSRAACVDLIYHSRPPIWNVFCMPQRTCITTMIWGRKPRTWNRGSAKSASIWQRTVCQSWNEVLFGYKTKLFSPGVFFVCFFSPWIMPSCVFLSYARTSERLNHLRARVATDTSTSGRCPTVCLFTAEGEGGAGGTSGSAIKQHLDSILLARWTPGSLTARAAEII